jgi:RNA polymerase sigma factor (sigma-70 family)
MNFFSRPKNNDDADDDQLLNSYRRSGELVVLGKLYERQMPLVYGVCLKYLKEPERAQDAVMAIFEELITKAKQHDIKQFKSWLYVVSRNYCLIQLRGGKKMEMVNVDDFMESTPFLHHEDENKETVLKTLEQCMERLAENQKTTVNLFYIREKCYKEIAETTGFTLNEVKSYIQNGKRNLKICMERNSE